MTEYVIATRLYLGHVPNTPKTTPGRRLVGEKPVDSASGWGAAHVTQESEVSFVSAAAHWWAACWKSNVIMLFQCSHFISKKIETEQKQPVRWQEGIILQFQKGRRAIVSGNKLLEHELAFHSCSEPRLNPAAGQGEGQGQGRRRVAFCS